MDMTRMNKTKDNNNNIIIINHTQPGVCVMTAEDGERILSEYLSNVCSSGMTGVVAAMIEKHLSEGMTVEQVIECIHRTGMAPRPSPAYLRAVLRNYGNSKPQEAPPWWAKNPALNYEQRTNSPTFDDDEFIRAVKNMSEN